MICTVEATRSYVDKLMNKDHPEHKETIEGLNQGTDLSTGTFLILSKSLSTDQYQFLVDLLKSENIVEESYFTEEEIQAYSKISDKLVEVQENYDKT